MKILMLFPEIVPEKQFGKGFLSVTEKQWPIRKSVPSAKSMYTRLLYDFIIILYNDYFFFVSFL